MISAATAPDGASVDAQLLEAGCEDNVAGVDGELGVARKMGEADLAGTAMAGLSGIAVGDPDLGSGAVGATGCPRS